MKKPTSPLLKWMLVPACALTVGTAVGAGSAAIARQYFVQGPSSTNIFVLPGGNAANDGDIARLDTRTGAVYRYRGDINNPNVRGTWELRAAPVKEANSGMLEIQQVSLPLRDTPGFKEEIATFLVDIVTGQTWVLRQRASTNASWDPVDVFNHSNWGYN